MDCAPEWDAEVVRQTLDTLIRGHGDGVNLRASKSTDQQYHGEPYHIGGSDRTDWERQLRQKLRARNLGHRSLQG